MVQTAKWDSSISTAVPREEQFSSLSVAGGTSTEWAFLRGLTPAQESNSPDVTNFPEGYGGTSQTLGREDTGFFLDRPAWRKKDKHPSQSKSAAIARIQGGGDNGKQLAGEGGEQNSGMAEAGC